MAFDAFIKIDGIEGESTDDRHQGWIEILAFGSGLSQIISRTASSAGGATAERADFDLLTFSKLLDKSSPLLMLACAAGTHIDEITVELFRAGPEKVKFMAYKLKNSLISSVLTSSGDPNNGFPVELVKISFGKEEICIGMILDRSVSRIHLRKLCKHLAIFYLMGLPSKLASIQ